MSSSSRPDAAGKIATVDVKILECADCGRPVVAVDGVRIFSHKCSGAWKTVDTEHVPIWSITELPAIRSELSAERREVCEVLEDAIVLCRSFEGVEVPFNMHNPIRGLMERAESLLSKLLEGK